MSSRIVILLSFYAVLCLHAAGQIQTSVNLADCVNSTEDGEGRRHIEGWSVGGGTGVTHIYAQLPVCAEQPAYYLSAENNVTTDFTYGLTLSEGGLSSSYPQYQLASYNQFTSLDLHIAAGLGAIITAVSKGYREQNSIVGHIIDGGYAGLGIGVINNNITRIVDIIPNDQQAGDGAAPIIKRHTLVPYIPFNVGYNLYVKKFLFFKGIILNGNFQYNWCLANYVDGYNMPFESHKHTPVYTVASVGIRFFITHANPHTTHQPEE